MNIDELFIFIKTIKKMGYENILDFLECIDIDGDRGIEDLETMKKILRTPNQN